MAFSGSSFFVGVGTAFAAVAVGFAGGAMITTSAVQPPNRLERLNSGTTVGSNSKPTPEQVASSAREQPSAASPPPQLTPSAIAATPDPQPSQPAASLAAKTETNTDAKSDAKASDAKADGKTDTATPVRQQGVTAAKSTAGAAPVTVAKGDDAAPAKGDRANARSADSSREVSRKRTDDRRFSERRRQQDQDERRLDEATNAVRQMPRDATVGEVVERDPPPRYVGRPRHVEVYEDDDGPQRVVNEPPRAFFGLFGN
jgi:hypothetical protein